MIGKGGTKGLAMRSAPGRRKHVAILGAGPAGLAAAMALSDSKEYCVHVYQMGWKAGGKCSTGREPGHLRTQQNGSHYLFGCYQNAFALARKAYGILRGSSDEGRFGDFVADVVSRNLLVGKHRHQNASGAGVLEDWCCYMPQNMAEPGDGRKLPTPFDYFTTIGQHALAAAVDALLLVLPGAARRAPFAGGRLCLWLFPLCPFEPGLRAQATRTALRPLRWLTNGACLVLYRLLRRALVISVFLVPEVTLRWSRRRWERTWPRLLAGVRRAVETTWRWSETRPLHQSHALQRRMIMLDLCATLLLGYCLDGLYRPGGFLALDGLDFREWLRRHGAREDTVRCGLITSWYDAIISYEDGEVGKPSCSAGLTIHSLLRSLLTYKGAFAYQLRAEIGDSLIAPIVRALELRGVQFHFYQRVKRIVVDERRALVTRVELGVQFEPGPARAEFIEVKDQRTGRARCAWSSQPGCGAMAGQDPELDSYYCTHEVRERQIELRPAGALTEKGSDRYFDLVISALPIGVMADVLVTRAGQPLRELPGAWADCFAHVQSIESQAIRMWFTVPLRQQEAQGGRSLGWLQSPPILSGFTPPHGTWEDNSQSAEVQEFPKEQLPRAIATLFGPLPTGDRDIRTLAHWQAQQRAAEAAAWEFVESRMLGLWRGLQQSDGSIAWEAFVDLEDRQGRDRFLWQHTIANVGPNESYVACLPGTLRHRIRPDESGFQNLYLAGDWTRNGVNIGTVEGAVVSGLEAAQAISGYPSEILGAHDIDRGIVFG